MRSLQSLTESQKIKRSVLMSALMLGSFAQAATSFAQEPAGLHLEASLTHKLAEVNLVESQFSQVDMPQSLVPMTNPQAAEIQTRSVQIIENTHDLFSIVIPENFPQLSRENPITPELLSFANEALLLRLTGNPSYKLTPAGESFIAQNRRWLKSYNWIAVMQEGVKVDERLKLNFDEKLVSEALQAEKMPVWPVMLRPSLLVMGSVVQQGTLQKISYSQAQFQQNVSLLQAGDQAAVNLSLPQTANDWVYPVDAAQSLGLIQDWLMATRQDYLLSYQLRLQDEQKELIWRVFGQDGSEISRGRLLATDTVELLNQMLPQVSLRLVEKTQKTLETQAQLRLNLLKVNDAESLFAAQKQLKQDFPTINQLILSEVEGDLAQFDIDFQGAYSDFLIWLQKHSEFRVVHESEALNQIDVIYMMPAKSEESLLESLESQLNSSGVQ